VRESIIRALGRIGREAREAVPLLVQAITDRDATVRIETAQAIWRIDRDTDAAMKVLTELLNETTLPSILTASALGHEPGTPSDPTVLHHQLYNGLRRQVVQTLGEIGPDAKAAIPLLIKSIRDRDEYVSIYSADALGAIGSSASAAVPLLAEALTDPDRRVREAARKALQKIDPAAAESVLRPIE
jgi:HEAT repeat protein